MDGKIGSISPLPRVGFGSASAISRRLEGEKCRSEIVHGLQSVLTLPSAPAEEMQIQLLPTPAIPACPRMHVPAYLRLSRRSAPDRARLPRSTSAFSRNTARMQTASGSKPFQASVSSARVPLSRRFQCFDLQDGARLCGLDRHRLTRGFDQWQAAVRTHLQARRPIPAAHSGRWRVCRLEPGARPFRKVPLADATVSAQTAEGCCNRRS